jgi:hypothetical protein
LPEDLVVARRKGKGRRRKAQLELEMGWMQGGTVLYEYAVLVTNLEDEIFTLALRPTLPGPGRRGEQF